MHSRPIILQVAVIVVVVVVVVVVVSADKSLLLSVPLTKTSIQSRTGVF